MHFPPASLFPPPASPLIAGVDEAGRGPLAGPVSVAAVILDPNHPIAGLNDSKKLSEARREALYPQIIEHALAWHIEFVQADEIDELNILHATMAGMRRAVCALQPAAQLARIDGNRIPTGLPCHARALDRAEHTRPLSATPAEFRPGAQVDDRARLICPASPHQGGLVLQTLAPPCFDPVKPCSTPPPGLP